MKASNSAAPATNRGSRGRVVARALIGLMAFAAIAPLNCSAGGPVFGFELRPFSVQTFPGYLPSIGNIPASARTVPINPADSGAGTPILIPGSAVQPGPYAPLSVSAAPEMRYRRFTMRAGLVWSYAAAAPLASKCSCGSTQEVNYQGSGRTVGAALVFYAGEVRPSLTPGLFGEVELRAAGPFSFLAGYQRSGASVSILQGWDRFDSLASHQRLPLSSETAMQPYVGIRIALGGEKMRRSVYVSGGPAMVTANPTMLGREAVLRYAANPFFITAGIGLEFGGRR